jgi:hypothetical protein
VPRLPDGVTSMPNQQDDRAGPSRSSGLAWRSHRRTGRPTARCVLGQLLYSLIDSHRRPLPLPPESPDATAPGSATSQAAFESTGGVPPNCEPPEREWERDDLAIPFPDWRGRGLQNRKSQDRTDRRVREPQGRRALRSDDSRSSDALEWPLAGSWVDCTFCTGTTVPGLGSPEVEGGAQRPRLRAAVQGLIAAGIDSRT